mgnify:CR=1 FL=1
MFRWIFKYSAFIFIFNTFLLSIESTYFLGNQLFLFLSVLFTISLVLHPAQIKLILFHKSFLFLLLIHIVSIIYFLLFHNISDLEALKYLFARVIQFSIISFSIYHHYDYYKSNFLIHLSYFLFFLVLVGFIINPFIFSGRYSGVMWNPNAFSVFLIIGFGAFFLRDRYKSSLQYFMMFTFLLLALSTGSRGVIVAIILMYLLKYRLSVTTVLYACFFTFLYFLVINLDFDTSLNRFAEQELFNDRILQYKYAFLSIKNKLISGYGLDKYAYLDRSLVPLHLKSQIIGAHNGYLAILTQYGIIFGSIIIYIIARKAYSLMIYFYNSSNNLKVYLFIIIYTLVATLYESLIVGINEFNTILFWFSMAILSFTQFRMANED